VRVTSALLGFCRRCLANVGLTSGRIERTIAMIKPRGPFLTDVLRVSALSLSRVQDPQQQHISNDSGISPIGGFNPTPDTHRVSQNMNSTVDAQKVSKNMNSTFDAPKVQNNDEFDA
jgi:hypothetical protein